MARSKTSTARTARVASTTTTTSAPPNATGAPVESRRGARGVVSKGPQREVTFEETFDAPGGRYRWREGVAGAGDATRRSRMQALFARTVVPSLEKRGARGEVFAAEVPGGVPEGDARWVSWRSDAGAVPVWGLYAAARSLDPRRAEPANDTYALVAWGDGPAIAWVADGAEAHSFVRAALHAPPAWMSQGFASGDPVFPVKAERVGASGMGAAGGTERLSVLPSGEEAARAVRGEGDTALGLLRAWRREHGREPFEV